MLYSILESKIDLFIYLFILPIDESNKRWNVFLAHFSPYKFTMMNLFIWHKKQLSLANL